MPRRYTTELIGANTEHGVEVRIVRDERDSWFVTFIGTVGETPYPSLEAARESLTLPVTWRSAAPSPGEASCFACGAMVFPRAEAKSRYPEYLCIPCIREAVDARGREVAFFNESLSGGFVAKVRETGEVTNDHVCFVRGIECWADEAYFGGVVIVPAARRRRT